MSAIITSSQSMDPHPNVFFGQEIDLTAPAGMPPARIRFGVEDLIRGLNKASYMWGNFTLVYVYLDRYRQSSMEILATVPHSHGDLLVVADYDPSQG